MSLKIAYRLALGIVLTCVLLLVVLAASREYSTAGALLVFGSLVYLFGVVVSSTRYVLCTALVLTVMLIGFDRADRLKFQFIQSHLNAYDLFLVGSMVAHWDTTVAWQYMGEVWPFLFWFSIAVLAVILAFYLERAANDGAGTRSGRHAILCSCIVLLGAQLSVLGNSRYLETTSTFHTFLTSTEPGGLRVSTALNFALRMARTWSDLHDDARLADEISQSVAMQAGADSGSETCISCPDLVVVHLESTFDPVLLDEYSHTPGYLATMAAEGERRSLSGPLLVNIYGGSSWISEFELLCGMDHAIFGDAGLYPHLFVSPYVKGCVPAYLKSRGYRTFAIYTTNRYFAGVGDGFHNYGIDLFLDNGAVGAPVHWRDQRDIHFIDALRTLLSEPSDQPRFIFVSTNSNHGPHGGAPIREGTTGPFDSSLARNSEVADYVNRLNRTYATMLKLEQDIANSSRPIAVLFYGDHQPAFKKVYGRESRQQFKRDLSRITLFRMMRTYGDAPSRPTVDTSPTSIVSVAGLFLEFAGVSAPPNFRIMESLSREACPQRYSDCPGDVQRMLRAASMIPPAR